MFATILWLLGSVLVIEFLLHEKAQLGLTFVELFEDMTTKNWIALFVLVFLWPLAIIYGLCHNGLGFLVSLYQWRKSLK